MIIATLIIIILALGALAVYASSEWTKALQAYVGLKEQHRTYQLKASALAHAQQERIAHLNSQLRNLPIRGEKGRWIRRP